MVFSPVGLFSLKTDHICVGRIFFLIIHVTSGTQNTIRPRKARFLGVRAFTFASHLASIVSLATDEP